MANKLPIHILSFGYTRSILYDTPATMQDDTLARLKDYAAAVEGYYVIVHSLKKHGLKKNAHLAPGLFAYPSNAYTRPGSFIKMVRIAIRLSRRLKFHVVQAQDAFFTGTAALLMSRLLRIPLVVVVYGADPFDPCWRAESALNRLLAPLGKWILRRADAILADGSATVRRLASSCIAAHRITLKPMIPFDIDLFFNAGPQPRLRQQLCAGAAFKRIVLFVGRIAPQKNLFLLIDVAAAIAESYGKTRFVCVGDGPLLPHLTAAAKPLADTVLFTGSLPRAEVRAYMAACDVFLLTSLYEGFARVLMEAAAAAKPIVTSAVGGADDIVADGTTGFIVPINDKQSFIDRLGTLISNPQLAIRMGTQGRERMRAIARQYAGPTIQVELWRSLARHSSWYK